MTDLLLDTSVAVPYLVASHNAHGAVRDQIGARAPALTGHSLAETYSVLTRLPGDARLAPADAVVLLRANFGDPALIDPAVAQDLPARLAPLGVAGGAVYDALVALAAQHVALPLATRDRRALSTYTALGTEVELVLAV